MIGKLSASELPNACAVLRGLCPSRLMGVLAVVLLISPVVSQADSSDLIQGNRAVTAPSPPPPNKNTEAPINCAQLNRDPRCRPAYPEHRPYPYHRRPIIVNPDPTPAPAPIDINALKDDWEGCRATKIDAINSRRAGSLDQANRLDEWLWKNCRNFSEELRDLE